MCGVWCVGCGVKECLEFEVQVLEVKGVSVGVLLMLAQEALAEESEKSLKYKQQRDEARQYAIPNIITGFIE